ncbi:hypothetical protein F441_21177 [Phytophthora nicotianae CJ01A1]|uniref:Uncharacterized protein n=2 Tax=Phytophthora nicotianae TaxID=4792 RepID=W2VW60_PHYNI|nr:hypothetical protein F444_21296 [Phytophthora nicotianae P1976]ETP01609.1 hypothetical protein F441_21177 [Phytophthora nicotianae CJ01A1]
MAATATFITVLGTGKPSCCISRRIPSFTSFIDAYPLSSTIARIGLNSFGPVRRAYGSVSSLACIFLSAAPVARSARLAIAGNAPILCAYRQISDTDASFSRVCRTANRSSDSFQPMVT